MIAWVLLGVNNRRAAVRRAKELVDEGHRGSGLYEIRIKGRLDGRWAETTL